jgi:hypothetical protein
MSFGLRSESPIHTRRTVHDAIQTLDRLTDVQRQRLALHLLRLIRAPDGWVLRRVDRVSFVDAKTFRWQISVDFRTTGDAAPPAVGGLHLIPISTIRKHSRLKAFDLRDEEERSLPLLTRRESDPLLVTMLLEAARLTADAKGVVLSAGFERELALIPYLPPLEARHLLRALRRGVGAEAAAIRSVLDEADFADVAYLFASDALVLAWVGASRTQPRRVLKLRYESVARPTRDGFLQHVRAMIAFLFETVGWKAKQLQVSAPVGSAQTYHIEFEAPADLEVVVARLVVEGRVVAGDFRSLRLEEDLDGRGLKRAHLRASGWPSRARGNTWVKLRAQRGGFLIAAPLTALLSTALLWLGEAHLTDLSAPATGRPGPAAEPPGSVDAYSALLFVVPAVISAFIIRPGEHAIASRLLGGVRLLVALAAGSSVAAAAVLAAGVQGEALDRVWTACASTAGVCAVMLVISSILPFARGEPA